MSGGNPVVFRTQLELYDDVIISYHVIHHMTSCDILRDAIKVVGRWQI